MDSNKKSFSDQCFIPVTDTISQGDARWIKKVIGFAPFSTQAQITGDDLKPTANNCWDFASGGLGIGERINRGLRAARERRKSGTESIEEN